MRTWRWWSALCLTLAPCCPSLANPCACCTLGGDVCPSLRQAACRLQDGRAGRLLSTLAVQHAPQYQHKYRTSEVATLTCAGASKGCAAHTAQLHVRLCCVTALDTEGLQISKRRTAWGLLDQILRPRRRSHHYSMQTGFP